MPLTATQKKLLNNATPGLKTAKLGDIIDGILKQQEAGAGGTIPAANITDATPFGRSLLKAADATAAKALLGL